MKMKPVALNSRSPLWSGLGLLSGIALTVTSPCSVEAQAADTPVVAAPLTPATPPTAGEPSPALVKDAEPPQPVVQAPPTTVTTTVVAVEPPPPPAPQVATVVAETTEEPAAEEEESSGFVKIGGLVEAYYHANFNKPENGITNNRWLDEKHNKFTLQTVLLDVTAEKGPFSAKVGLMFGPTADRWYFEGVRVPDSEPGPVLGPAGYNNETWKHLQYAYGGYKAPIGDGLLLQAGLFTTQVGYEGSNVKDNWNWSRSNLFNFLPFFHLGGRASYPLSDTFTLTAAVYNGYNQATDLNKGKTVSLQGSYVNGPLLLNVLYMGGNERPSGYGYGSPWRSMFDLVSQYDVNDYLSFATHLNAGFESGNVGDNKWFAGAVYARVKALEWLYFAARGDGIWESVPSSGPDDRLTNRYNNSIFILGANRVNSVTGTVELRPGDGFSFRVEYRYDNAQKDSNLYYFTEGFDADGNQKTTNSQSTLTLGATAWF